MLHEMTLYGFTIDMTARAPVAILKDEANDISMPIWLTLSDAVSLASSMLTKDDSPRRGKDDFLTALMGRIDGSLKSVRLDRLPDGSVGGEVLVMIGDQEVLLDVLPSEALTLSLRYDLPLHATSEAVAAAAVAELPGEHVMEESEAERMLSLLEQLDPAEMGKYPM